MRLFIIHGSMGGDHLTPVVTATAEKSAEEALKQCNAKGAPWSKLRPVDTNHKDIEPTIEAIAKHLNQERPVYLFSDQDEEVLRISQTTLIK